MTAPRKAATTRRKPAVKPAEPVESLAEVAERVARNAPVLGGLKHNLVDVAKAAGAYRRTLMAEGIGQLLAEQMMVTWHDAHWQEWPGDEDVDPDPDADLA